MKIIFADAAGNAWVEEIHPRYSLIEHWDGYHPGPNYVKEAVYFHENREYPPLMIYWQGTTYPEGTPPERNTMQDLAEMEIITKDLLRKLKTSKLIFRRLIGGLIYFAKLMYLSAFLIIIVLLILSILEALM